MLVNVAQFGVLGTVVAIVASVTTAGTLLAGILRPKATVVDTWFGGKGQESVRIGN